MEKTTIEIKNKKIFVVAIGSPACDVLNKLADILSAFKCEGSGYRLFWLSQPFHPYTRRVPTRELNALIYYIQNYYKNILATHQTLRMSDSCQINLYRGELFFSL